MSELKSFLATSSSLSQNLTQTIFSNLAQPLQKLKSSANMLLFNLCIEAPEKMIAQLSGEDIWSTPLPESEYGGQPLQDLDFGERLAHIRETLLPQSIMSQVERAPGPAASASPSAFCLSPRSPPSLLTVRCPQCCVGACP